MTERSDMESSEPVKCTCTFVQPTRESVIVQGYRYAIYVDEFIDESVIDSTCPYHGTNGTHVLRVTK